MAQREDPSKSKTNFPCIGKKKKQRLEEAEGRAEKSELSTRQNEELASLVSSQDFRPESVLQQDMYNIYSATSLELTPQQQPQVLEGGFVPLPQTSSLASPSQQLCSQVSSFGCDPASYIHHIGGQYQQLILSHSHCHSQAPITLLPRFQPLNRDGSVYGTQTSHQTSPSEPTYICNPNFESAPYHSQSCGINQHQSQFHGLYHRMLTPYTSWVESDDHSRASYGHFDILQDIPPLIPNLISPSNSSFQQAPYATLTSPTGTKQGHVCYYNILPEAKLDLQPYTNFGY